MSIELVGDIAEERNLCDFENLEDLIKKFIHSTSLSYLKPMFEKEIGPRINKIKKEKRDLVSNLLGEIPLNSQEGDIQNALLHILRDYIACDLDVKYDSLDPKIFQLERAIVLSPDTMDKQEVSIPLFAGVSFGDSPWKYSHKYEEKYKTNFLNVESKAPPIPKEVKEKARKFSSDYLTSIARTLEDHVMGNLLLKNYDKFSLPNLLMYWIPSPQELKIEVETVEKDPILVANNLGRSFLIDNWFVKGEQPYEHYLLEFKKSRRN